MSICDTIRSFARQREKAYAITRTLNGRRAAAISKIQKVSQYMKGKNEWRAVIQCRQELLSILPAHDSRFSNQREKIITLITTAHELLAKTDEC